MSSVSHSPRSELVSHIVGHVDNAENNLEQTM